MEYSTTQGSTELNEGRSTKLIEEQTAKVPSLGYLGLAVGSMAVSAIFAFGLRKRDLANFIGLWAPSILVIGLYNKVVKIEHELAGKGALIENSDFSSSSNRRF